MKTVVKGIWILAACLALGAMWFQQSDPESFRKFWNLFTGETSNGDMADKHDSPEGHHFSEGGLNIKVNIFEGGGRPEFRIEAKDNNGHPILPSQIDLIVELKRLGGQIDQFTFVNANGVYRSKQEVKEPHSFKATIKAHWRGSDYSWSYSQIEARAEIDDEMAQLSGIKVSTAGPASLKTSITLTGEVGLDETKVAHVVPRMDAVVKQVRKHIGDAVKKGETLVVMESRELADSKSRYLKALKKMEPLNIDLEREALMYKNTIKMLELLKPDAKLKSLEPQLNKMILGESRSKLVPAFAKLQNAEYVYMREKKLYAKKISSQFDYFQAREEYQSAEANYNALREKLSYEGKLKLIQKQKAAEKAELDVRTTAQKLLALGLNQNEIEQLSFKDEHQFTLYPLRAPLHGEVIQKHATVGEAVSANDDIFVLADLSQLWVNIAVPAKDLNVIKLSQEAFISESHQGLKASGKISFLGSVIDEITRSVIGRVIISNPKRLWRPGMYVTVELVKDEARVPVSVSAEAVQEYRGWQVVFVKYGNFYEARPVRLGKSDGNWIEVLEGLQPDEPYVSTNSFAIKAELGKSGAVHSH